MERLLGKYLRAPLLRGGSVRAYAFAVIAAGFALVLRLAIDPYVAGLQYVTFFPAVIITTLVGGVSAGLACLALSIVALAYFLLPPHFSLAIENISDLLNTSLFVLLTLCNVILIGGLRIAMEAYEALSHKLAKHEEALGEREEHLAVVVAELQHRTRNLLSVVGAIADNTIRTSGTLDDFKVTYHDRLEALGRAQGLLFRKKEGGRVTFDELVDSELAAHAIRVGGNGPVTVDGPKGVRLRSGTVQTLAMVLHELMSNAVKHGALKQPCGHLTVRWYQEISADNGKPWLHFDWKETGVAMPSHAGTGNGRTLIERALPYQFGAKTSFALEGDGIHCTISVPTSEHGIESAGNDAAPPVH